MKKMIACSLFLFTTSFFACQATEEIEQSALPVNQSANKMRITEVPPFLKGIRFEVYSNFGKFLFCPLGEPYIDDFLMKRLEGDIDVNTLRANLKSMLSSPHPVETFFMVLKESEQKLGGFTEIVGDFSFRLGDYFYNTVDFSLHLDDPLQKQGLGISVIQRLFETIKIKTKTPIDLSHTLYLGAESPQQALPEPLNVAFERAGMIAFKPNTNVFYWPLQNNLPKPTLLPTEGKTYREILLHSARYVSG
jgi:hypothetical protein